MTSSSNPTKHPKPRNRPIRIRRLRAGFRAVVAGSTYTEHQISDVLNRLTDAGHAQRRISLLMNSKDPSSRVHFYSVHDALRFHSSEFRYPLVSLRAVTPEQHTKIRSLGGVLSALTLDNGTCIGAYVFDNLVLGVLAMTFTEPQSNPLTSRTRSLWQQIADDCPTLEDVANRYFNDNEPGTLDLLRVTARLAA